jgi:hypothetical protein
MSYLPRYATLATPQPRTLRISSFPTLPHEPGRHGCPVALLCGAMQTTHPVTMPCRAMSRLGAQSTVRLLPNPDSPSTYLILLWIDIVHVVDDPSFQIVAFTPYPRQHDSCVFAELGNDDGLSLAWFCLASAGSPRCAHQCKFESETVSDCPGARRVEEKSAVGTIPKCSVLLTAQRAHRFPIFATYQGDVFDRPVDTGIREEDLGYPAGTEQVGPLSSFRDLET